MDNEPDRPTVEWKRPNAEPQRPTTTWSRSAPTPTPGKPDTSRHPGRQVSRLAHVMATHSNNQVLPQYSVTPEGVQLGIDNYRETRGNEMNVYRNHQMRQYASASFKNRHNKDYDYQDIYDSDGNFKDDPWHGD